MKVINNKKDILKLSNINKLQIIKPIIKPKKLIYPIIIRNKKDLREILATGLKKGQC